MFILNSNFIKGYGSILGSLFISKSSNIEDESASLKKDFDMVARDMHNVFMKESKKIDLAYEKKYTKDK
ncbi:MAG: hypothetical protein ACYCTB_10965 [bacterium]